MGTKSPCVTITPPGKKTKNLKLKRKTIEFLNFNFLDLSFSLSYLSRRPIFSAWRGSVGGLSQSCRDTTDPIESEKLKNKSVKLQNSAVLHFTLYTSFQPRATEQIYQAHYS
jgi:hypothetical protein